MRQRFGDDSEIAFLCQGEDQIATLVRAVRPRPPDLPVRHPQPVAGRRRPRPLVPARPHRPDPLSAPRRPPRLRSGPGDLADGRQRVHGGERHPRRAADGPGQRTAHPPGRRPWCRRHPRLADDDGPVCRVPPAVAAALLADDRPGPRARGAACASTRRPPPVDAGRRAGAPRPRRRAGAARPPATRASGPMRPAGRRPAARRARRRTAVTGGHAWSDEEDEELRDGAELGLTLAELADQPRAPRAGRRRPARGARPRRGRDADAVLRVTAAAPLPDVPRPWQAVPRDRLLRPRPCRRGSSSADRSRSSPSGRSTRRSTTCGSTTRTSRSSGSTPPTTAGRARAPRQPLPLRRGQGRRGARPGRGERGAAGRRPRPRRGRRRPRPHPRRRPQGRQPWPEGPRRPAGRRGARHRRPGHQVGPGQGRVRRARFRRARRRATAEAVRALVEAVGRDLAS